MVEIELDMDYLFGIRRISKLQLCGRGILDDSSIKNLEVKFQDGKLSSNYCDVEDVLYFEDLVYNDFTFGNYVDADYELSESLNDCELVICPDYNEILYYG